MYMGVIETEKLILWVNVKRCKADEHIMPKNVKLRVIVSTESEDKRFQWFTWTGKRDLHIDD